MLEFFTATIYFPFQPFKKKTLDALNKIGITNLLLLILGCFTFSVQAQTSSFTYQSSNGIYCSPSTINFTQTSTGNPIGFTWSFDNGEFSNSANPSITFTAGTYVVKLITVFETEAIESSQTIVINSGITGTLSANRNYICIPGNINFTTTSSGNIATYEWTFGDATAAVTTTTPNTTHNYSTFGIFNASVKATNTNGCFFTASTTITVQNPPISGTASPSDGCIPANVNFTANVDVPLGSNVTNYLYNYGDASPTSNSAAHTYTAVGSYNPSVSITTNEGCTNTFNYPTISFGTPATNHFATPSKFVYCGSETAIFTSSANNANTWFWDYGDGITETVNSGITQHKYLQLGTKMVKVTPFFNGCPGTTISFTINIVGVIADFTYTNTCTARNTFTFTNTTQGNQSVVTWNFGDGSPTSSATNVTHTFPTSGSFITTLTITDNATGCKDVRRETIFTAAPTLINPAISICRNSSTTFTIENNYTTPQITYSWNVVGLPTNTNTQNPYTTQASVLGNFTNNFVIINNGTQYCADTIKLSHPIVVKGPNLSFTAAANICAQSEYNIINTSSAFIATDTVKLWYWNYGMLPTNDTIYQPQPKKYASAGTYSIKLVAKDISGCIDSLSKQVVVRPIPFLRIFPRNDTLCLGKTATIIAFHSDSLSWSPAGSLSCATCDTVIANPSVTTLYYARANNSLNCPVFDSTLITVFQPFTAVPIQSPVYVCLNDSVKINASPSAKKITWAPTTNISNAGIYNPFVSPPISTLYTATLVDSVGCFSDTTTIEVIVKTLPSVNAGADQILPYNSFFTITPIYGNNVVSYQWMPANLLNCTACPITTGNALTSQQYVIKVTSDSGCVKKDSINIFIECKYANLLMPSAFTPNRDGNNDFFYPLTRGIKTIKKFIIYNRYGQPVFEASNFSPNNKIFGWDGNYKGLQQKPDTYVYFIETICELGEIINRKGSFLLLR